MQISGRREQRLHLRFHCLEAEPDLRMSLKGAQFEVVTPRALPDVSIVRLSIATTIVTSGG